MVKIYDPVFPELEIGYPVLVWFVEGEPQLFDPDWSVFIGDFELHYGRSIQLLVERIDDTGAYGTFMGEQAFIPLDQLRFKHKRFNKIPS